MKNQPMKSRKFVFIENKKERKINIFCSKVSYMLLWLILYLIMFDFSRKVNPKTLKTNEIKNIYLDTLDIKLKMILGAFN